MNIENLKNLTLSDFINSIKILTEEEKKSLDLKLLPITHLKYIINNSSIEYQKEALQNKEIFDVIMNSNKSIDLFLMTLLNNKSTLLKVILESNYINSYTPIIYKFIKSLSEEKYNKLKKEYCLDFISLDDVNIKEKILEEKLNNEIVRYIYDTYGLICSGEIKNNSFSFTNGFNIEIENIKSIKISHLKKIISALQEKSENTNDNKLFEVAIKLYLVFGFDISKKIIDDKFSHLTKDSITRIAKFTFKYNRDEFRLHNSKCFYYHGLEFEVLKTLTNNYDNTVLENILCTKNETKIQEYKKKLTQFIMQFETKEDFEENLKSYVQQTIHNREDIYKKMYYDEIKEEFNSQSRIDSNKITTATLYSLLKTIDLDKVINTYKQDENLKELLIKTLFGNLKVDNDCIFRLIYNNQALGLNNNLAYIINYFQRFKTISTKSELSLNSIIDIMDMIKIGFLKLKPNEKDIKLSTLTKIVNSNAFIIDTSKNRLQETLKLHHQRKQKYSSSIPFVKGTVDENKYYIAPYDAEYLLAAGIDGENCFKIGGLGEEFFKVCLTNHNAALLYIEIKNKKFIIPIIRSGNAINMNGIDPKPDENQLEEIKKILLEFTNKVFEVSKQTEPLYPLQIATISDLNALGKFKQFEEYQNAQNILPHEEGIHTDYTSSKFKHFIINKSNEYKKNLFYESKTIYMQPREEIYEYKEKIKDNYKNINIIINSIYYTFENQNGGNYTNIDIRNYSYIVGNKDWFIIKDDNHNIKACCLENDPRAIEEYKKAFNKLLNSYFNKESEEINNEKGYN